MSHRTHSAGRLCNQHKGSGPGKKFLTGTCIPISSVLYCAKPMKERSTHGPLLLRELRMVRSQHAIPRGMDSGGRTEQDHPKRDRSKSERHSNFARQHPQYVRRKRLSVNKSLRMMVRTERVRGICTKPGGTAGDVFNAPVPAKDAGTGAFLRVRESVRHG